MVIIRKYSRANKQNWDSFVKTSKNGHFMFYRAYMEYHADRFIDHSLMIFDDRERIVAILPANLKNDELYAHEGLTFGGFLLSNKTSTNMVLDIFESLKRYLKLINVKKLIYKPIPHIYTSLPAQEDLYALFINNAKLFRRNVSSAIDLKSTIRYSKGRKWSVNKAKKEDIEIYETTEFSNFWCLLSQVLQINHEVKPVHSLEEIEQLHHSFPDNIKLFIALHLGDVVAGAVVYETTLVAHTQYLSNSQIGRDIGALDLVIDHLIKKIYKDKKYFDFGISTENNGQSLNTGLIAQKEGFGARAVVHDFYELEII